MITFETEEPVEKKPTFGDVEENQPFVSLAGQFCMKSSNSSCVTLTRADGVPWVAYSDQMHEDKAIQRILPRVAKINF